MDSINAELESFDFMHCTNRQGYIFTSIKYPSNVLDAIVIRNPECCMAWSPKKAFSNHTLDEHISIINQYKLEKACVICENIDFITKCPTLKYLEIIPADSSPNNFDYSPLYKMPEIRYLSCKTKYGGDLESLSTYINYSKISGLREVVVTGDGHLNYQHIESLECLSIENDNITDFSGFTQNKNLKRLNLFKTGIRTLHGIEQFQNLQQLDINYEKDLYELSGIEKIAHSLRAFSIDHCPKIKDTSCIETLLKLEHLALCGNNELCDLNFLSNMHSLKTFVFSMKVKNGDLTPCVAIPYVHSVKNRKEYNLKDKELPKNLPLKPFELI